MASKLTAAMALLFGMAVLTPAEGDVAPDTSCKEAKAKAAVKQAGAVLRAYMRNEKRPNELKLGADISKCDARLATALSRAEATRQCSGVEDSEAIEEKIDAFVAGMLAVISPSCGDGLVAPGEECDAPEDGACPGQCRANCTCTPCGIAGWPTCGGACPALESCGDIGFGCGCVVAGDTPCGSSFPACDGACPSGQTCGENAFLGCVCVPDEHPRCGDAQAPACDGACWPGLFCVSNYDACSCLPGGYTHPCGSVEGSPSCLGGCPSDAPICSDVGGVCTCTAYPSPAFLDRIGVRLAWF
jgi:hypothetical protein